MMETLSCNPASWVRPSGYVPVQYQRPERPPRRRDVQRQRVYDFENECIGRGEALSLAECDALAETASAWYLMRPPTISDGRGRRHACAVGDALVKLPRWSRVPEVVLHEVAHCVVHHYLRCDYGVGAAGHGPEFVRVFLDLLSAVLGTNADTLSEQARARGVQVGAKDLVSQAPEDVVQHFRLGPPPACNSLFDGPTRDRMRAALEWRWALTASKGFYVCSNYVPALDLQPPRDRPWSAAAGEV